MKIDTIFQNYLTKKEFVPKMESISRIMEISLPKKQSAFLWGPRKTGKTTYLRKKHKIIDVPFFDASKSIVCHNLVFI